MRLGHPFATAWVTEMPRRWGGMLLKRPRISPVFTLTLSGTQVAGRRPAARAAACSSRIVLNAAFISFISRRVSERRRAVGLRGMPSAVVRNS